MSFNNNENDFLFNNYNDMIIFDPNKLKLMIAELFKTQTQHSDSILELIAIVSNHEKQDEVFKRLGLLEKKSNEINETQTNV